MRATDKPPEGSRDEHADQARDAAKDRRKRRRHMADRASVRRARRAADWGRRKYSGSWAEYLQQRLTGMDFLNQATLLAATLLLCAVPFMLITAALAGRSAVTALTERLGLNHQAATDVGDLFTSSSATTSAVTGLSWVFFLVAGMAAATSFQRLYQVAFGLRPRGVGDRLRALVWLAVVAGWIALGTSAAKAFYSAAPVLWWIVNVAAFIGFWWFTMWFLLAGRVPWRRLVPCAVATGLYWLGMLIVFHFVFSGMVIEYDQKYGPIGVVFALMSFFIAIGVVITLGAATGMTWHDRGMSWRAAARKLRRSSS
ncbi:YhjD/YihY/BrkB family envelope integrity protein [Yinghuangia seranimata]|uniref:YhjD/YihY/BrkB family envelope integrity protein n=1 Tax=Yinghuangia seranimata TaxID=408067 RepID=UPI00248CE8CD|nr:YhjD/YihY/BrkB family envelope integrity protein [Yinghuangia seranimata]MDI2127723.1 YhjD/YihY/BrkB family envelope integrity protein [Yinghuangia seranimata]